MEIVIDIPEESYKATCDGCMLPPDVENVVQGIKNGIPLPEHHGRLIDADALLDKKQDYGEGQMKLILIDPYYVRKAPTIIEADKESDSE